MNAEEPTVVDTAADTAFGVQLDAHAWSAGDPPDNAPYRDKPKVPQPQHHSWATVARRAALALSVGVGLAGVVLAAEWVTHAELAPPPLVSAPSPAPPPSPSPAAPPPSPSPAPPPVRTLDDDFLDRIRAWFGSVEAAGWHGWTTRSYADGTPPEHVAMSWAHGTCDQLRQGETIEQQAEMEWGAIQRGPDPHEMSFGDEVEKFHIAAEVYCPDLDR